ncbi:hypothetical protein CSZ94_12080 [Janthinobacterium sp. ROICE36]|uniref:hypothetical protein n=1 Tax=Janthinobacterium sp. ROICE36 TaxID=2048670 RepID=UPI000C7F57AA|nr:hypothetical protein [Janthinobacterium sp. ROICE36]PLY42111.1 hypothetical protein CSZ94_12080 [Janthinobacterium sp. ROICE36]
MSYVFTHAANALSIAEQQYATAGTVRFSAFTSCIGLLARNGTNVTGVHLVMFSNTDSPFDNAAAEAAIALLGAYQQVVVIGQTGMWDDNFHGPYQHLLAGLAHPIVIDVNDGTYGGRVANNVFQTYQNGNYINV